MERILVLSCSKQKREDKAKLPALERYDGPAFRVLRKYLSANREGQLSVYILSAKYGLIGIDHPTDYYDEIMTHSRAVQLRATSLDIVQGVFSSEPVDLCISLSGNYMDAIEGWEHFLPPGSSTNTVDGSQGVRLKQLKEWLWGEAMSKPSTAQNYHLGHFNPSKRNTATIHGVVLESSHQEILQVAKERLALESKQASKIRDWYFLVDGEPVSPKWLVSILTNLRVSTFTSGEARRFLRRFDIVCASIKQETK